jgi:hypothetical protein
LFSRCAARLGLGACIGSAWLLADDLAQKHLLHLAPHRRAAPLPVYPHAQFYPLRLLRFVGMMREVVPAVIEALQCATVLPGWRQGRL